MKKMKEPYAVVNRWTAFVAVAFILMGVPAFAASNAALEERIAALESSVGKGVGDKVTLSGTIEIEAGFEDSDLDGNSSDTSLATAELGVEATPLDWLTGFVLLSWEDEDDELIVDEAHITLGGGDVTPYYLTAGKIYVPFGVFETLMISDPLTLEIGEIVDNGIQVGFESNGFYGAAYLFNGAVDEADEDDTINNFGFSLGYAVETEAFSLDLGGEWIQSILESGALSDLVDGSDLDALSSGVAVHAMAQVGPVCMIGEYVGMVDDIEYSDGSSSDAISAWAVELGYAFDVSGFETIVAAGLQGTDEAGGVLPESGYLFSIGVGINDYLSLAAEYAAYEDYEVDEGGDENDVDVFTVQLALEF